MQGVDVLVPQRIRKAAPLSFFMGTYFCGLEERKLKCGESLWQRAGISKPVHSYPYPYPDIRLGFGRVHLKVPLLYIG